MMQIADCVWDLEIREAAIIMSSYCNPQAAVIGSDRDADLDNVKQERFTKQCLKQNTIMTSFSSSLRQPNAWPSEEMWDRSSHH